MWYCLLCCTWSFALLSLWMNPLCMTIQRKTIEVIEEYFYVVLSVILYKVVLTLDASLLFDHSNESRY